MGIIVDSTGDNAQVEFDSISTAINPSVSVTDNGWAKGVWIGPHNVLQLPNCPEGSWCCDPPLFETESISITIYHPSGYTNTVNRYIMWKAPDFVDKLPNAFNKKFYFYATNGEQWADGSQSYIPIASDLFDEFNPIIWWQNEDGTEFLYVGEDGVQALLGSGQENNLPRNVYSSNGLHGVEGSNIVINPRQMTWNQIENGLVNFTGSPLDKNVGVRGLIIPIGLSTSYKLDIAYNGSGINDFTIDDKGKLITTSAILTYNEPLNTGIEIESLDGLFLRDGIHSPNIVSTVTWKNELIKKTFIMVDGTIKDVALPIVTFKSGLCIQENSKVIKTPTGTIISPIDTRGNFGCLDIAYDKDATLTSYSVQTSLSRTTSFESISNDIHTHACTVDDSGNGQTTSTIVLKGIVIDHEHIITNYETNVVDLHSHGLRCVAITQLNPTLNTSLNITINGYAVYDPTNCEPNSAGNASYLPILPYGNRMIWSTLNILGYTPSTPKLEIISIRTGTDLKNSEGQIVPDNSSSSPSATYFTAYSPYETAKGIDIKATGQFSEYVYEDYPGHSIIVPARPVDDGSRMTYTVSSYKPLKTENTEKNPDMSIVAPDLIIDYAILKITVSIASEGQYAERFFYILISSNLQWIPGFTSLMPEFSNDSSYITTALDKIGWVGSSPLHDAVKEVSQKIVQFQTDNPSHKQSQKVIFLVTDGDENTSEVSLDQAINSISFIDGVKATPAIGIQLGHPSSYDEIIMKKYAVDTNGKVYQIIDFIQSDITNLIDQILETADFGINYGTYSNIFEFDPAAIPISFSLGNTLLPDGSNIVYRIRYSADDVIWSTWSNWVDRNTPIEYDESIGRISKYQIEVAFFGNKYFETPTLYETSEGVSSAITYYKPLTYTTFFQPFSPGTSLSSNPTNINDLEYVSSILITHEADIPSTSTVNYGIVQSEDLDINEYLIDGKTISPDKYEILLTRYNEPLSTLDNKNYIALNGRWPKSNSVTVYRFNSQNPNGLLVPESYYSTNSIEGVITFFNVQITTDSFVICVEFKPFVRLIANVTNYGKDGAIINHIGVIYNIMKRIPYDLNGNIIHKPINKR